MLTLLRYNYLVMLAQNKNPKNRKRMTLLREYGVFALLVLPNLLLFGVFVFYPIGHAAYLSLTRSSLYATRDFVGIDNYIWLFTSRISDFWEVMRNTVIFATGTVTAQIALALLFAMLLSAPIWGRVFFRTAIFLPYVTTTAAVAYVWVFVLDSDFGILNAGLTALVQGTGYVLTALTSGMGLAVPGWMEGLVTSPPDMPNWLGGRGRWALPAIMLVQVWKTVGFATVIYLAGLSSLDSELQEAARIDGAHEWQVFRFVTFPLLSPVTFFLAVTGFIAGIQTFDIPAVMTGGGPLNATTTYVYYLFELAFENNRAGRASALAMVFFVLILLVTWVQLKFARRWVHTAAKEA